jgi:hypothetical protein
MPKIRCLYVGCVYLEKGYCTAPLINVDPDEGCLTFTQLDDPFEDASWEEELGEMEGFEEWDEDDFDDDWMDDDDF